LRKILDDTNKGPVKSYAQIHIAPPIEIGVRRTGPWHVRLDAGSAGSAYRQKLVLLIDGTFAKNETTDR
jgi:hypothetical protein